MRNENKTDFRGFRTVESTLLCWKRRTEPVVGMTGFELKPFPVVAFQDVYGNFVSSVPKTPAVKAFLVQNSGNATLLCGGPFPCVRLSVEGRIHFDGLGVNNIGKGYILEFEALLAAQNTGQDRFVRVQSSALCGYSPVTLCAGTVQCLLGLLFLLSLLSWMRATILQLAIRRMSLSSSAHFLPTWLLKETHTC